MHKECAELLLELTTPAQLGVRAGPQVRAGHSPKQLQISSREDVPAKEPMPTVILEVKFARGEGEMKCLS